MTSQDLVPKAWRDDFVLALRAHDADGRLIGDALADVEQFCRDSGRDAFDAFGDAGQYANALVAGRPREPRSPLGALSRAVGLTGMMLVLWSVLAGEARLTLTVGNALAVPLILGGATLVTHLVYLRRTVAAPLTVGAVVAALVLALVVLTSPLAVVPTGAAAAVGVVLLVGHTAAELRWGLRRTTAVTIASPWEPDEVVRRRDVRASVQAAWIFPAMTAVGALTALGLERLLR